MAIRHSYLCSSTPFIDIERKRKPEQEHPLELFDCFLFFFFLFFKQFAYIKTADFISPLLVFWFRNRELSLSCRKYFVNCFVILHGVPSGGRVERLIIIIIIVKYHGKIKSGQTIQELWYMTARGVVICPQVQTCFYLIPYLLGF